MRASSRTPKGSTRLRNAPTFPPSPVISMMTSAWATLTIFARKMSQICMISGRVLPSALIRTSTSSRLTAWPSLKSVTSTTLISLRSWLMQRSSDESSPLRTVVIRDSEASWVGATLSVSMLKPRPENMPAMRASTPNLFSTRTEIVCRMESGGYSNASARRQGQMPRSGAWSTRPRPAADRSEDPSACV